MDFRFISVLVAFAGLFGLAFVILGVLQRSSNQRSRRRGRDDKGHDKQPGGKQGPPKHPSFHPCAAPRCSVNIPGQDLHGQCFSCIGMSHDMNTCDVCLLAKPTTQQCRAIRLYCRIPNKRTCTGIYFKKKYRPIRPYLGLYANEIYGRVTLYAVF